MMSKSYEGGRRWTWQPYALALLLAPALVMLGVRAFFSKPGPSTAQADVAPLQSSGQTQSLPTVAPAERELIEAMRERENAPLGASPFPSQRIEERNGPEVVVKGDDVALTLTSIMKTRRGAMAVLGGKLRQVGDQVAPGWRVMAIDSQNGMVTLQHDAGPKRTLSLLRERTAPEPAPRQPTSTITPSSRRN